MNVIVEKWGLPASALPVADFSRPEFAPMARGRGIDQRLDGQPITRKQIEDFNEAAMGWAQKCDTDFLWADLASSWQLLRVGDLAAAGNVLAAAGDRVKALKMPSPAAIAKMAQVEREGAARLAWWDAEGAPLSRAHEASGYSAAAEESDRLGDEACDATNAVIDTPATTAAGTIARLRIIIGRFVEDSNEDYEALASAFDDLLRVTGWEKGGAT